MAKSRAKSRKGSTDKENQPPKTSSNRPIKLRSRSNDSMVQAMDAVKSGLLGVNRAALEYGVPKTTLKDRIAGRVSHGTNIGSKPYLSKKEEEELVKFLINCSKMGYGKTRSEVLKIVEATLKKKNDMNLKLSQGWWWRFRQRWPQLTLRRGDSFSLAREKMTNYDVFHHYFDLLGETFTKYDLKDKPSQIYNCDESGMPLEHKLPRVVAIKGTKKVRQISSGNKTQITVLGCCSASGQVIPPMVVFSGKKFNHDLADGEVPSTLYGMSESGWMDQELFADWFSNHFLKHAVSSRPLLLMLDGHSSHYTLELIRCAAENEVIIFCLPPHTTADSQPLDTCCFGPLKTYWSEACHQFMFANPGRVVSKFQFSKLFSQAWSKGMSIDNITSAFRTTGIYPFNPDVILDKFMVSSGDSEPVNDNLSNDQMCTPPAQPESPQSDRPVDSTPPGDPPSFPPKKIELFEKRFENGYNVFTDSEYVAWLQIFHPSGVPSPADLFLSVSPHDQIDSPGEF